MTEQNQIIALAKLDGFNEQPDTVALNESWGASHRKPNWQYIHQLPPYLTSRDAIWPLIQGLSQSEFGVFIDTLSGVTYEMAAIVAIIKATIPQLAKALLRARGIIS